jgi:hypothetical protein
MSVKARVYSSGRIGKQTIWNYAVTSSDGHVVLYDNSCGWEANIRRALIRVEALRHMETAGHKLHPYQGQKA